MVSKSAYLACHNPPRRKRAVCVLWRRSPPKQTKGKGPQLKKRTSNLAKGLRGGARGSSGRRRQAKLREENGEREQKGRQEEDNEKKGKQLEDKQTIPERAKRKSTNKHAVRDRQESETGRKENPSLTGEDTRLMGKTDNHAQRDNSHHEQHARGWKP